MDRATTLRRLALAMGAACVLIGVYHLTLGIVSVPLESHLRHLGPGEPGRLTSTVDGRERFYSAIFVGYGLFWIHLSRLRPVPAAGVRWAAAVFLLGGVGRVLSIAEYGWPHWLQVAEAVLELGLPPLFWWLAPADEAVQASGPTDPVTGRAAPPAAG